MSLATLDEFCENGEIPQSESLYEPDLAVQYSSGERKLNKERERITESAELSLEEKRGLYAFDRALRDEDNREGNREPVTRSLYVCHGRLLQRDSGLFLKVILEGEDGKEALDDLLEWVQNQNYSGNYIHKLLISIKTYGELCGSDEIAHRFDAIKPGKFREDNEAPLPGNIITWEEALEVADTRSHPRDRAWILTGWGSGARPESELLELQYKHLEWAGDHYIVTVPWNGKTGRRDIRLYAGAPTLKKWVEEKHPVHDDPDATLNPDTYIWTKEDKNDRVGYATMYRVFTEAGEAADLGKDYNPRHYRRSRASFLAGKPTVSEQELREFFGWCRNSPSPKNYICAFREDIDRNIAAADGASDAAFDEQTDVSPVECNHCGQLTERHQDSCVWCHGDVDEDLHGESYELNDPATEGKSGFDIIRDEEIMPRHIDALRKLRPLIKQQGDALWDNLSMLRGAIEEELDEENIVTGPGNYFAQLSAAAATAAGSAFEAWGRTKTEAAAIHPRMTAPREMSTRRKAWFYTTAAGGLVMMFALLHLDGSLQELASGDLAEWLGLIFALAIWKWLLDRNLPDIEQARVAARKRDS